MMVALLGWLLALLLLDSSYRWSGTAAAVAALLVVVVLS